MRRILLPCFTTLILVLAGCGGVSTTDDDVHVLNGSVTKADGSPVAGALVTVAGIEANTMTGADGSYEIRSPYVFPEDPLVTAQAPGFTSSVTRPVGAPTTKTVLSEGDLPPVILSTIAAPTWLEITTPTPSATVAFDACEPAVVIEGLAGKRDDGSAHLDLVILIDRSGSTGNGQGAQTVYARQLAAARQLVNRLANQATRIALVPFAAEAEIQTGLTDQKPDLLDGLLALEEAGPLPIGEQGSGTDFSTALTAARSHLQTTPLQIDSSEDGETLTIPTTKAVVLLTDGIPTLPVGSGTTQERGDIDAALAAAELLAAADIRLIGYALELSSARRNLTTLPAMAAITGGRFSHVTANDDLAELMNNERIRGVGLVTVTDDASGTTATAAPGPDGRWAVTMPITVGNHDFTVAAHADTNADPAITRTLSISAAAAGPSTAPQGLEADQASVTGFRSPYGQTLRNVVSNTLTANFADLREARSAEIFTVVGTANTDVTVTVKLLAISAGWRSDLIYLVVNELEPTTSAVAAFAAAPASQVIFNSHDAAPDVLTGSFTVPAGSRIVFALTPKNTLARAQAGRGKAPHYSLNSLNVGGYDQLLSWYSAAGRNNDGTPVCVLSWEDMPLAHRSDRDFWDVIFTADNLVPGMPPGCPTDDS